MDNLNEMDNLEEIRGVGKATAEKFRKAGYKTLADLAKTTPKGLARKTKISSTIAKKILKAAKEEMETTVAEPVFKPTDIKTTLLKDILPSVLEDYKFKEEILKEIVEEVSDLLEDDPVLRGKVIKAALQKPEFRSRVANYVAKELT